MHDKYLILGGAGFIGTNLADHYLGQDKQVTLFDRFSRPGTEENVRWLQQRHGPRVSVVEGDVRRSDGLLQLVEDAQVVFHLAGQVAVTTSIARPREDFEINALGTLNVLEAVRTSLSKPIVVYSSTNKVYGSLADVEVMEKEGRYAFATLADGVPETHPMDFCSPYGCSKGSADQYVRDYARVYGLNTIVFRQSCIYGPHQFGVEDQGWVAWFGIRALQNRPVTIYGDGKQVRDVLYVDDLISAYDTAVESIARTRGEVYNIGGGPKNTLSLLQLVGLLEQLLGRRVEYSFGEWRMGDQRVFISRIEKARADIGWEPRVGPTEGVSRLVDWLRQHESVFVKT